MKIHRIASTFIALAALGLLAGCGGNAASSPVGTRITPTLSAFSLSPSTANSGTNVSFTVGLSQTAYSDQSIGISCSGSGMFSNLPSSVTVPAGSSSVTFTATLSSTANGSYTVTATQGMVSQQVFGRAIWGE